MRMGTTQAKGSKHTGILGRKVTDSLNDKDAGFQRRGRGFRRQYAGFYEAKGSHLALSHLASECYDFY